MIKDFVISAELARILKAMDSKNEFQTVIEHNGNHRAVYVQTWKVIGEVERDSVDYDDDVYREDYTPEVAKRIIADNNNIEHAIRNGYMIDVLKEVIDDNADISIFNYASRNQLKLTLLAMANLFEVEQKWLDDETMSVHERHNNAVDVTAKLSSYYDRS